MSGFFQLGANANFTNVTAREVVVAGSNNIQKVMRVDGATGNLKFFNRTGAQGAETEELITGSGGSGLTTTENYISTARTVPVVNPWRSVCWSPELRLFCAVATSGSTNRAMTSQDGITWTSRTTVDNTFTYICWASELRLFCAVSTTGNGNRVITSPDGITWTTRTSVEDKNWQSICWSPELRLFVAVSDSFSVGGGSSYDFPRRNNLDFTKSSSKSELERNMLVSRIENILLHSMVRNRKSRYDITRWYYMDNSKFIN
jgi:hypothetical protein